MTDPITKTEMRRAGDYHPCPECGNVHGNGNYCTGCGYELAGGSA